MRDFSSRETKPKDVFVTVKTFQKYHVLLIVPAFATYTVAKERLTFQFRMILLKMYCAVFIYEG